MCERNSPADPKVSAEGEEEGAPSVRAEIPLEPMVQAMVSTLAAQSSIQKSHLACSYYPRAGHKCCPV